MPPRAIVGPSVSVVFFLLSESIDGGIKGKKKKCIDTGFQGRERERGREGVSWRF